MLMDIRDYVDSVLQGSQSQSSASLTPIAQTKAFERQNYINNMIKGVLSKVSYALDAIPPSVDISPGPVDNLAFGGLALANKGFKNLLRSGDDVEKLAGAVIKNRVPLTDDFDTAVDIVKSLGQTGKHPQFEDYMKAMDTIKDESKRQLTPQELAKNPAVDAVIERIQPRLNVEDTAKLPTQTGELNSLNPTGNVLAKYNAKERASLPLGKNITSLAQTSSKSPDEMITIYRGVKDKYGSINSGDFITTNPQLAKDYSGGGKVLSKKVRLGDILDDVSEPLGEEYIYRPQSSLPTQVEGLAKEVNRYATLDDFIKSNDDILNKLSPENRKINIRTLTDIYNKNKTTTVTGNYGVGFTHAKGGYFVNEVPNKKAAQELVARYKQMGYKVKDPQLLSPEEVIKFNQSKGVQNKGGAK